MKKILTLAAALLVVGASASMAQGLNLAFTNCGPAGLTTVPINCNANTGATIVVNASAYPASPMGTFAAATAIIDVRASGGVLPLWWQTRSGQCRANSVGMTFDPNTNSTDCADIWGGNPNLQVTDIQQGLQGPEWVRFIGVAALPAGSEIPLATGTELWVCRLTINKANTLSCAGCSTPSSMVFNELYLQDPNEPAQKITNVADGFCVGLSGGAAACPGATPATNRTWGAVKNLYR